jgi:hypothetical protein
MRKSLSMPSGKHERHKRIRIQRPRLVLRSVSLAAYNSHSPPGLTAISLGSSVRRGQFMEQCRSNPLNRTTRLVILPTWRSLCQTSAGVILGSWSP